MTPLISSQSPVGLALSLAASAYRCYPGEPVRLKIRMAAAQDVPGLAVVLTFSDGLRAVSAGASAPASGDVGTEHEAQMITWRVGRGLRVGEVCAFDVELVVDNGPWVWRDDPHLMDIKCVAQTLTDAQMEAQAEMLARDTLSLAVFRRSKLARHLPGLYQDAASSDASGFEFMWRFMMVFERLSMPVERRIEDIWHYFDPALAPASLLDWLAWCIGFTFEPDWPEAKRRETLGKMAKLYRKRGTRAGLQELVQLYIAERPDIIEHSASFLRLGRDARLGYGTALGSQSRPHEFTVVFRKQLSPRERELAERLIRDNKPAHTGFDMEILKPDDKQDEQ